LNTVLIAGASGVIGEAALAHFAALPGWQAIAVSRRVPEPVAGGRFRHLSLDLTDPQACRAAAEALREVTHIVYAAVSEQPGLVAGWRDREQMQLNLRMLQNLVDPVAEVAPLQHVTLLQGGKAYGAHVGIVPPLPARERAPRVEHENFYWLHEDYIRAKAEAGGFGWTIFRPQVVIGAAPGVVMNPLLPVAAFAAIRKAEGLPFSYPGGAMQIGELVDSNLLAEAVVWAATAPAARNETFNIANGDLFSWREAWPALADAFGMQQGADEPMLLAEYLPPRAGLWDRIVERDGLRPLGLMAFLGESHHYIDILTRPAAAVTGRPNVMSTIKIRQAGFGACRDSEDNLRAWIDEMRVRKLIPTR
jgi:nucleoside-diphosphate-sugar epimerase